MTLPNISNQTHFLNGITQLLSTPKLGSDARLSPKVESSERLWRALVPTQGDSRRPRRQDDVEEMREKDI